MEDASAAEAAVGDLTTLLNDTARAPPCKRLGVGLEGIGPRASAVAWDAPRHPSPSPSPSPSPHPNPFHPLRHGGNVRPPGDKCRSGPYRHTRGPTCAVARATAPTTELAATRAAALAATGIAATPTPHPVAIAITARTATPAAATPTVAAVVAAARLPTVLPRWTSAASTPTAAGEPAPRDTRLGAADLTLTLTLTLR